MLPISYLTATTFALSSTVAWASRVCSPSSCLKGSAASPLLARDQSSNTYIIPGTYSTSYNPSASFNETLYSSSDTTTLSPPPSPVGFTNTLYTGSDSSWSASTGWSMNTWESLFLPNGWYAVVGDGKVLWNTIPNKGQLPNSISESSLISAASSSCDPPCSSHGLCASSNATTCQCSTGWSGAACDQCVKGYWGPSCTACSFNCTVCDDGISGTGACLSTATSAFDSCNCSHGSCTSSTECTCSAGRTTNSTTSSAQCNTCADGFFQDAFGNCLACPLGCSTCTLQSNTNNTATCHTCLSPLTLNDATPSTCTASTGACADGTYYDSSTSTCATCSPACTTCTGPSTSECLACASPRANLDGACAGYDSTTGICDSSFSKLDGVFVVNNDKKNCDSCPVGCLSCHIPSFSTAASFDTLACTACQEGYLLENGQCVQTCSTGWYLPTGSATTNGTCQQCDNSCNSCVSTATTCTSCPGSTFAHAGSCISTCPIGFVATDGTCAPCPVDCATCTSTSTCASCPSSRPVLQDGRCIEFCPTDHYFDISSSSCKSCDSTCSSCIGSDSSSCTSCPDGSTLKNGQCATASCGDGGFAAGLGVCLSSLVNQSRPSKYLAFLALIALLATGALRFWLYVRGERRRTREATREFGDKLDDVTVSERLKALRLQTVLGIDRIRGFGQNSADNVGITEGGGEFDESRKRKFRELLLPSRRRTEEVDLEMRKSQIKRSSNFAPDREDGWGIPPPPYAPSPPATVVPNRDMKIPVPPTPIETGKRDSLDSIPTPTMMNFNRPIQITPAKIVRCDQPSQGKMGPAEGRMISLRPPPRPGMKSFNPPSSIGSNVEQRESNVKVSERERGTLRPGFKAKDGMITEDTDFERRLREIWPAIGLEQEAEHGQERRREREGYI